MSAGYSFITVQHKKYVDIYRCKRQVCKTFIISRKENPTIFKDNPQSPIQFLQNILSCSCTY